MQNNKIRNFISKWSDYFREKHLNPNCSQCVKDKTNFKLLKQRKKELLQKQIDQMLKDMPSSKSKSGKKSKKKSKKGKDKERDEKGSVKNEE
jgi:hypothetical protein